MTESSLYESLRIERVTELFPQLDSPCLSSNKEAPQYITLVVLCFVDAKHI